MQYTAALLGNLTFLATNLIEVVRDSTKTHELTHLSLENNSILLLHTKAPLKLTFSGFQLFKIIKLKYYLFQPKKYTYILYSA